LFCAEHILLVLEMSLNSDDTNNQNSEVKHLLAEESQENQNKNNNNNIDKDGQETTKLNPETQGFELKNTVSIETSPKTTSDSGGESQEFEETGSSLRRSTFEDADVEESASAITQILTPVCITMAIVVCIVRGINLFSGGQLPQPTLSYAMVYQENENDSTVIKFFGSILNALIVVGLLLVVTVVMVLLYKYRCLKIIYGWMMMSVLLLLAALGSYLFYLLLYNLNIAMDYFTFVVVVWNFSVVGLLAIFWHAPLIVNQGYLIAISVILATVFTQLPPWTTWAILVLVAIYDLFAVLCPRGPLRVLVETAQERDEPIPALIYNASIYMLNVREEDEDDQNDRRGVKLGLGDFVFYSVLIGRASMFDILTVFTCFIAIVQGLFLTILLLALFRKALPALPISIFFGFIFYILTTVFLYDYVVNLGLNSIFV
jgi:presenilin 1